MRVDVLCLMGCALAVASSRASGAEGQSVTLVGWGIDEKNLEECMAGAEAVGFDVLITWNTDPTALTRIVQAATPHGIQVFSSIAPMGRLGKMWTDTYPDRPVPWQVMSEAEQAAHSFITAGENVYLIPYQWGGEPVMTHEVLTTPIICMSVPEGRELLQRTIDGIAAVPGITGLAFDGFGYQNYHCCYCERCQSALAQFRATHPDLAAEQAEVVFFRDLLVNYINGLADYARSRRPELKTAIHIWPVFAPEPLYGNRLDVDYCGQTAAWYTLWPQDKIAQYSRIISAEAKKYWARQEGEGMIGYYDHRRGFPVKDAARVDMELRTMIENGCRRIQVCSAVDVIRNPEIAAVFSKYCK